MADWFRRQPKIADQREPAAPAMPPLPATPVMPPLPGLPAPGRPATPPPAGWTKAKMPTALPEHLQGVSGKVVMHHFARGEVRNLNAGADGLHAQVVEFLRTLPEFRKAKNSVLTSVIEQMTWRLQSADLTINFNAHRWFASRNASRSYQQMYERGAHTATAADGSQQLRISGTANNDPFKRDSADTRVTFGQNINTPGMQGAARFMQTGGLQDKVVKADGTQTYAVNNTHFNPKARQNFAGLNYARIMKGAAPLYGASYLILKPGFKTNAIYYMGDTFDHKITAAHRATHGMLFSLILYAAPDAVKQLLDTCYRGIQNPRNYNDATQLIEAHIFDEIRFAGGVETMMLNTASLGVGLLETPEIRPETVVENATEFCTRNGIKLAFY
jgi:hypothetical protein